MAQTLSAQDSQTISTTRRFMLWALAAARFQVATNGGGIHTLFVPDERPQLFNGAKTVRFAFGAGAINSATESVSAGSRMFDWALSELKSLGTTVHSVPVDYVQSIHEISPKLFEAYTVEGGSVQLSGCALEDRPVLRLTYRQVGDTADSSWLSHVYLTPDGHRLTDELAESLGVDDIVPAPQMQRLLTHADTEKWLRVSRDSVEQGVADRLGEFLAATVVWIKWAEGKLAFSFGDSTAELPFSGWARRFARGFEIPPPYVCPYTGQHAYHLVATDDHQITVAHAVGTCDETKRRCLRTELKTCDLTGKLVRQEFLSICPVSQRRMLDSLLEECEMCRQRVSPAEIRNQRCSACRSLSQIRKEQPAMARVLGEHPALDRWRRWKMAETTTVYILEADSLWKRLLVVVDKESLDVIRLATGSRLGKHWSDVPETLRGEYLGT